MPNPKSALLEALAKELAQTGRFFAQQGWSPATSSNYSAKLSNEHIAITRSGVDKQYINSTDIITIDMSGQVFAPPGEKSSAETLIHTAIYAFRPMAKAVLHTHSAYNTRLSLKFLSQNYIQFSGYEMQKGITGNTNHNDILILPILDNSQDMMSFAKKVENLLVEKQDIYGFLIAGHGLYAWGDSIATTRRHVETFEFLMTCMALELLGI